MAKTVLAELVTRMTVESAEFKKELEKTTAKVHAHGAANQKAANDSKFFSGSLKDVAANASALKTKIIGSTAAIVAMGAATLANTQRAAAQGAEITKLSNLAGESVEQFQAYAYAFKQVGVEQDKFADISKDVQDKLGDFIATGAGPFKDFFEQVAPKVGLTVDALKDLSSTDVLIAVKNAMDAANVSAKEQVFYMEAIANDATLLIPALKDGGKQIKQYAAEFNELNAAMSATDIAKLKEFDRTTTQLGTSMNSLGNTLAQITLPAVRGFTEWLTDTAAISSAAANGKDSLASLNAELNIHRNTLDRYRSNGVSTEAIQNQIDNIITKIQALKAEAQFQQESAAPLSTILDGVFAPLSESAGSVGLQQAQDHATKMWQVFQDQLQFESESSELQSSVFQPLLPEGFDFSGLLSLQDEETRIKLEHYQKLEDMQRQSAERQMLMNTQLESSIFNHVLGMASQTAALISQGAEEGSAIQKAAFLAAQGIAFASTIINTEMAAIAALAPPPIGLGPVAGAPYATAIRALGYTSAALIAGQTIASFEGGGYIPDGPRSGGMDGRGGRLAVVHPDESIIDHKTQQPQQPAPVYHINVQAWDGKDAVRVLSKYLPAAQKRVARR